MRSERPSLLSRLLDTDVSWSRMVHVDKLTWISRALSLAGFAIASYLTTVYLARVPPVCLSSGGCVTVQHSSYAHIAGIPLPVIGLVGYTLLFITACLPGQRARTAGMVQTVFAIVTSVGLTYIELEVIHAICIWCVGSATCAALHVVVNSARYVRGEGGSRGLGPSGRLNGARARSALASGRGRESGHRRLTKAPGRSFSGVVCRLIEGVL